MRIYHIILLIDYYEFFNVNTLETLMHIRTVNFERHRM